MIAEAGFTAKQEHVLQHGDVFTVQTEIKVGDFRPSVGELTLVTPREKSSAVPGKALGKVLAIGIIAERVDACYYPISELIELRMKFIAHVLL